jgi:carboxyl-terminal processing protease
MGKTLKNNRSLGSSLAIGAAVGMSAALIFTVGFFFREIIGVAAPQVRASSIDFDLLQEVQNLLDQHYLRAQPDPIQREYAAIRGVVGLLEDRYTFFVDPPVAQSESDVLAGTYGGIGVQVNRNEVGQFVIFPFEASPAELVGIENGDILSAVNGELLLPETPQDVVDQQLRGEVKDGNGVEITVVKVNGDELTTFIEFGVINVPSVIWRVLAEDNNIGYVQVIRFTSRTPEELEAALLELNNEGISALILDLRNNSGGLLQESVSVAGDFLDEGQAVVIERSRGTERTLQPNGISGQIESDLPLVVLVNQGTASASELVAGAIQDHDRGILIGQQTFGKGTVQQIFRLSDNSSLHITSAEWLTPNRRQLEGAGLEPDIVMIPDINGRDVELGEAIRQLQQLELE